MDTIEEPTPLPKGEEPESGSGIDQENQSVRALIELHSVSEFLSFLLLYGLGSAHRYNLRKLSNSFVNHLYTVFSKSPIPINSLQFKVTPSISQIVSSFSGLARLQRRFGE